MLMYTSCGWFFDEISGIETTQILQYAARVIQLAKETLGQDWEGPFIKMLEEATHLAVPCAFVVPLDDSPDQNASQSVAPAARVTRTISPRK